MSEFMGRLADYGVDLPKTLKRFVGDEKLYETCFKILIADKRFEALGKAIDEEDYDGAVAEAHALKGVIGNMGLDPMYNIVNDIVEALRQQEYDGLKTMYADFMQELEKVRGLGPDTN